QHAPAATDRLCGQENNGVGAALLPVDAPARVLALVDRLRDAPSALGEIGGHPREGDRLRARAQAETREDEVAGGGTAGTVRGKRRIGERLEAQGGDGRAGYPG